MIQFETIAKEKDRQYELHRAAGLFVVYIPSFWAIVYKRIFFSWKESPFLQKV